LRKKNKGEKKGERKGKEDVVGGGGGEMDSVEDLRRGGSEGEKGLSVCF
jgi:hypothetical protein